MRPSNGGLEFNMQLGGSAGRPAAELSAAVKMAAATRKLHASGVNARNDDRVHA
jgi:hypothetical protein